MALILTGVAPSFAVEKKITDDEPDIKGTSAIMIDAGSGDILYEKNIYEKRDPASITKILTALVVIETLDLNQKITVPFNADDEGLNIKLKKGEVLTVEQLLYAMLLGSANDAADTLGIAVGGTTENFCRITKKRAEQCGAKDTIFANASGLNTYGEKIHQTTAYDLAMIAREAMKNPIFRKIVSTEIYVIPPTNMSKERKLKSTNKCLYQDDQPEMIKINGDERPIKYDGTTGIKTGYTSTAGECFCGSAKKGNTELIVVVLNSSSKQQKFTDTITLWEYGFSNYYTYKAARANESVDELLVWQGERSHVPVGVSEDIDITLSKNYDNSNITIKIIKNERMLKAPIKKGEALAYLTVYNENGETIAVSKMFAMNDVDKGGPLSYIYVEDKSQFEFIICAVTAFILVVVIIISARAISKRRQRKRKRNRMKEMVRRRESKRDKDFR